MTPGFACPLAFQRPKRSMTLVAFAATVHEKGGRLPREFITAWRTFESVDVPTRQPHYVEREPSSSRFE